LEELSNGIDQSDNTEYLTPRDINDANKWPRPRLLMNIETKFKEYTIDTKYNLALGENLTRAKLDTAALLTAARDLVWYSHFFT